MRSPLTLLIAVAVSSWMVSGCARKVVLDPELVARFHSRDWTIRRAPTAQPATPGAPPTPGTVPAAAR
jgi:hypothetical protein